jgi:hypothetical protein
MLEIKIDCILYSSILVDRVNGRFPSKNRRSDGERSFNLGKEKKPTFFGGRALLVSRFTMAVYMGKNRQRVYRQVFNVLGIGKRQSAQLDTDELNW